MPHAPERPAGVSSDARWLEDEERWQQGPRDAAGAPLGEHRFFRQDGSLVMICRYEAGALDGPFETFHPNGQPARCGRYVRGQLEGTVEAFASDGETSERLRGCCVPPGAWQMTARYAGGQLERETFFDREGRVLLSDGTPRPDRPAGVPEAAEYNEFEGRWRLAVERAGAASTWHSFDQTGQLIEELRYEAGHRAAVRRFARDGSVCFEARFDEQDRPHGPWRRRFLEEERAREGESPYADPRVHEERGAFAHGHAVGRWELCDDGGATLHALERGHDIDAGEPPNAAALENEPRSAARWEELARGLRDAGRVRAALAAAARAAGRTQDAALLRAMLGEAAAELRSDEAARVAEAAIAAEVDHPSKRLAGLFSALVSGGDPAALLRALAATVTKAPLAALDFVDASILLAPDRPMTCLTRALIRVELGDDRGALADAERVADGSPEAANFVRAYVRVLFPEWGFVPGREFVPAYEGSELPAEPGQPLDRIQEVLALYATRLELVRAALRRAVSIEPRWLPPALPGLLPAGPVALRRYTGTITDETDDGFETVEVEIDETLEVDGAAVPALLRAARAHWSAIGWICWAAGLDRIARPERLVPPAAFPAAMGQMVHRYFRARDVLETNGLRSLTVGVPGFAWEGMEIDEAPRPLVEIAVAELAELRAVFLWLASAENLSPFQSDLRAV